MYIYPISTGRMTKGGAPFAQCYSGNGEHMNNPASQSVRNHGPIPCGWYTIMPPTEHPKLGPIAMALIPDADNEMFDRSGFFDHGDNADMNYTASDGCIVTPRDKRMEMASNLGSDNRLQVIP